MLLLLLWRGSEPLRPPPQPSYPPSARQSQVASDPEELGELGFSMGNDVKCVDEEQYDGVCEDFFDSDYRLAGNGQLEVAVTRESGKLHAVSITAIVRDSEGLEGNATVSILIGGAR